MQGEEVAEDGLRRIYLPDCTPCLPLLLFLGREVTGDTGTDTSSTHRWPQAVLRKGWGN